MRSLILIRRRGWSGRIASLPLFWMSFFLPSFIFCFFFRLVYKSRRWMNRHQPRLSRRFLRQGCAFWGLENLILTVLPIFHQKSSKLTRKLAISSQNSETWNTTYFRKYTAEIRENLTRSWEHKMQFPALRSVTLNLANKFSQCTFRVVEHYGLFSGLIK